MLFKWSTVAIGFPLSIFAAAAFLKHNIVPASANPVLGKINPITFNPGPGKIRVLKAPAGSRLVPSQIVAVKDFSPVPDEPGVYTTQPFAGIVVVPQEHLDDSIALSSPEGNTQMPMLNPELYFIPLERK